VQHVTVARKANQYAATLTRLQTSLTTLCFATFTQRLLAYSISGKCIAVRRHRGNKRR